MSGDRSFRFTIRYFRHDKASGRTVGDVPPDVPAPLGGLRQLRVRAIVNGKESASNTMPAGGDEAEFEIERLT
jgi:hypothetical protein